MRIKNQEYLEKNLKEIRHLLSHLSGEVNLLEDHYAKVLLVLERVEQIANRDDLTGLLRRKPFFENFQKLLVLCHQVEENCGVMILDIDHFKKINDTWGHSTGDDVIRGVAKLLKKYESSWCVVGRLGGEEFILAMRGKREDCLQVAEQIREEAETLHIHMKNAPWRCTLSAGVVMSIEEGSQSEILIQKADQALYEAKEGGRNQVRKCGMKKQAS